jgi:hypothetical protein
MSTRQVEFGDDDLAIGLGCKHEVTSQPGQVVELGD